MYSYLLHTVIDTVINTCLLAAFVSFKKYNVKEITKKQKYIFLMLPLSLMTDFFIRHRGIIAQIVRKKKNNQT